MRTYIRASNSAVGMLLAAAWLCTACAQRPAADEASAQGLSGMGRPTAGPTAGAGDLHDTPRHSHAHLHPHPHVHGGHTPKHDDAGQHPHDHLHVYVDYSDADDARPAVTPPPDATGHRWWKGNLHTHTMWSDGDHYPEVVVDWYKRHGYHFLALSDHNVLSQGEKWINPATSALARRAGGLAALELYRQRFGNDWVQTRTTADGQLEVRLKPLAEFRTLFEEPGRFLMIQAEEITDHLTVHVIASNLLELIPPQRGGSVSSTIERNLAAVHAQREATGQIMVPHLAHPNFQWAITAEDMAIVEKLRFFEVYNGHRGVRNFGDDTHIGLDRMWDIVLTKRLGELGLGVVYGLAVDDAHHYEGSSSQVARPGRGWVMVRARFLTPEHLLQALESGDFYASSGVTLRKIERSSNRLAVEIEPEQGVQYTIEFIGTRRGYDPTGTPVLDDKGNPVRTTQRYSEKIGQVLATVQGTAASYTLQGDELYVRAKITSSKLKANPFAEGEFEMAWVQPLVPGSAR
jgi:hypothetical protein